jgi:hypothetical protein
MLCLSLPVASGNAPVTQDANVSILVCQTVGLITIYTYLYLPLGADEVSGKSWHLVTVIPDEGDDGTTHC